MEHFVRITMEKQDTANSLDESIFAEQEIYETEQGATVYEIPLSRQLSEEESNEYAQRLANYMFEQGHTDFDIDISTDELEETDEVTFEDDDDFFEEYGVMWYNDDDVIDEAEYQGRSFRARHNCDNPGPRHKARYWSCRKW